MATFKQEKDVKHPQGGTGTTDTKDLSPALDEALRAGFGRSRQRILLKTQRFVP